VNALAAVRVGATTEAWSALGFAVAGDGAVHLANGAIDLVGGPAGIGSLVVSGIDATIDVDGLVFEPGAVRSADPQPNGAVGLDHVVVTTDSLERTSDAVVAALGLRLRRIRETERVRQAFHRFDDPAAGGVRGCILEIVEDPRAERSSFWGLVVTVGDLDAFCAAGADRVSSPRPAVQPGRFIAGVRPQAALGTAVAVMSP